MPTDRADEFAMNYITGYSYHIQFPLVLPFGRSIKLGVHLRHEDVPWWLLRTNPREPLPTSCSYFLVNR